MSQIVNARVDNKKHCGTFVMFLEARCKDESSINQLCYTLCALLKMQARERVKSSFQHFLMSAPKDCYVEVDVARKQDKSVLSLAASSGALGFAPQLSGAYEYLEFTNLSECTPNANEIVATTVVAERIASDHMVEQTAIDTTPIATPVERSIAAGASCA